MAKKFIVMIVDSGGRSVCLAEAYAKSPHVSKILAVPGADLAELVCKKPVITFPKLKTTSVKEIVEICKKEKVDLVDVAQDNAVEAGVTDALLKAGISVIGPTRVAGQIEWDKAWAREFMRRHKIPHPKFVVFSSKAAGILYIKKQKEGRWFIKANGLVYGKGALPANNQKEAIECIKQMTRFGKQGETYLIEDWLIGEEFSFFALCDGKTYKILGSAQDYKRMFNGDLGENTGGMGCTSQPAVVNSSVYKQAEKIIKKTLRGLAEEDREYKGILYLGGIVVKNKVYVVEFNARWGEPEAEVVVPGIKNDLFKLNMMAAFGKLETIKIQKDKKCRVVVTLAVHPEAKGGLKRVFGIEHVSKMSDIAVYNTRLVKSGNNYYASSGRQLFITGEGRDVFEASRRVYEACSLIYFEGNSLHYRTDIGWRDVERLLR